MDGVWAYLPGIGINPYQGMQQVSATMAKTNPFQFIQQVRAEAAKIVWPTRREVLLTTIMVFVMAALTALFFSVVDLLIKGGLQMILDMAG